MRITHFIYSQIIVFCVENVPVIQYSIHMLYKNIFKILIAHEAKNIYFKVFFLQIISRLMALYNTPPFFWFYNFVTLNTGRGQIPVNNHLNNF